MGSNRLAIYTALVGAYDTIRQPHVVDDSFDYFLFSNDIAVNRLGVWQIRRIPYSNPDNARLSRWVKTHPDELLPDYDASVWIDVNIIIKSVFIYTRTRDLIAQNIVISSMWHNARNCIYDEAAFVAYRGLEKETIVLNWLRKLKQESYPHQIGLFECGVIFRIHHNELVVSFDNEWWGCINHFSRRDQLSFSYCLWKLNLVCPFFISSTENVRNSEHFQYVAHKQNRKHFDSKNDIVHYCRALSWYNPERLRVLYEQLVRFRCFLFFRAIVAFYYRVICYVIYLKQSLFLT